MTKGHRIKHRRELLQLSQTELANKVGISKQTLYKYENDIITNIPSDIIEQLAFHLECSPAYIMGWDNVISEKIMQYAHKIANLSSEQRKNVMQYIDFVEKKDN